VARIAEAGRRVGTLARLQLLLEVGVPGGRSGCRSVEHALEVARAARREGLSLRGVEAFEGILKEVGAVDAFLDLICYAATAIAREGLFASGAPVLLTAGGSAFYDRVPARL